MSKVEYRTKITLDGVDLENAHHRYKGCTGYYLLHKIVWEFFEDAEVCPFRGYFTPMRDTGVTVVVISNVKPVIPESIRKESVAMSVSENPYDGLKVGKSVEFYITFNPKKHVRTKGMAKAKNIGIKDETEILKLFSRKAEERGFTLDPDQTFIIKNYTHKMMTYKQNNPITIHLAEIRGILTITDYDKFHEACEKGIGGKTSLGVGTLMIANRDLSAKNHWKTINEKDDTHGTK